ncbi:MAG: threonine--tRNA ligase, partial [Oceanococcaceae bacterium]
DFATPKPFTPDDLVAIEQRMNELVAADHPVTREVMARDAAVRFFKDMGEDYKAEIIASIPDTEEIGLYRQDDFIDLCRGPHVPSTGKLGAFKLTKLAGAYWRGDTSNEQLQRVYGTAWSDKKQLKAYLHRIEEAAKRDHRVLGKKLDLFHFQEEAPGMVFWHDHGWRVYLIIEQLIRDRLAAAGYTEVKTPQIIDKVLWERSGHMDKYAQNMFLTQSEDRTYAIKPMNCPAHLQIFNQGLKSYRDLPLRMAEFGCCHRNEFSGALHGLMRVRGFTQDDAHIFCTEEQIAEEVAALLRLTFDIYRVFGFDDVTLALSTRPAQRVGEEALWDKAEVALETCLKDAGYDYVLQPGEGAFYGPKIEFTLRDCLERNWQCGTIQLDFSMPERLGAQFVDADGARKTPVMIHRAILGSLERFIGILIEQHAGALPLWLAPVQVTVATITNRADGAALRAVERLRAAGLRADDDLRNEKINLKIRELAIAKVPYVAVIGDREAETDSVAVRARDGSNLGVMTLDAFINKLQAECAGSGLR